VIQQNAGAAEEMSSTAEELSSQAEQLQSTISFFKTSDNGSGMRRALPDRHVPASHKVNVAHLAAKPKVLHHGVSLNMKTEQTRPHGDAHDTEFEKF